jgi:hypothetical protein
MRVYIHVYSVRCTSLGHAGGSKEWAQALGGPLLRLLCTRSPRDIEEGGNITPWQVSRLHHTIMSTGSATRQLVNRSHYLAMDLVNRLCFLPWRTPGQPAASVDMSERTPSEGAFC